MKNIIKVVLILVLAGGSFLGGVFWEYSAERQEIADIEQVALEACNQKIKILKKEAKNGQYCKSTTANKSTHKK